MYVARYVSRYTLCWHIVYRRNDLSGRYVLHVYQCTAYPDPVESGIFSRIQSSSCRIQSHLKIGILFYKRLKMKITFLGILFWSVTFYSYYDVRVKEPCRRRIQNRIRSILATRICNTDVIWGLHKCSGPLPFLQWIPFFNMPIVFLPMDPFLTCIISH
jgi:hypothetical protein